MVYPLFPHYTHGGCEYTICGRTHFENSKIFEDQSTWSIMQLSLSRCHVFSVTWWWQASNFKWIHLNEASLYNCACLCNLTVQCFINIPTSSYHLMNCSANYQSQIKVFLWNNMIWELKLNLEHQCRSWRNRACKRGCQKMKIYSNSIAPKCSKWSFSNVKMEFPNFWSTDGLLCSTSRFSRIA